jgi:hypothetical protein
VADTESQLLVITREDITETLDSELCGVILRMSLKAHQRIQGLLLDARKRAIRAASLSLTQKEASGVDGRSITPDPNNPKDPTSGGKSPLLYIEDEFEDSAKYSGPPGEFGASPSKPFR